MRCRFGSQNCETIHAKQKWTKSCTIWKYYRCLEPEWPIFWSVSPIKWKVNPPKIRSVGFQMYRHRNNGDISPGKSPRFASLVFETPCFTPRFGDGHPAGLDEDTSTWTGQEEYSSSSSFMAKKIPSPRVPRLTPSKKKHETSGKLPFWRPNKTGGVWIIRWFLPLSIFGRYF